MRELFLKHALLNAVEHGGRADVQAVLGKVIAEKPELKTRIGEIISELRSVVEEVNRMGTAGLQKKISEMHVEKIGKKEEKRELPDLPGAVVGKVVTAFPPEPSKYPHLGHAKGALMNYLIAKKYRGKFILRFEDSNPELAKKDYYEAIVDGLKWLGIKWNKVDYLSDHLPQYYKVVENFLKNGFAYVCLCRQEIIKQKRADGEVCKHRSQDAKTNLKLWKKMLKSFGEGRATVRLRIDMQHPNTTMRDPSIVRIIKTSHPRTKKKFRVWPVYDFGTAMLDAWEKVTHRVRSKEFELRKELQEHIHKLLGVRSPHIIEVGRFEISGAPTKGRIIREMVQKKQITGWDDPRLTTLIALRRRGFLPEAISEFLVSTGLTKAEGVLEWSAIEAVNRKHVDRIANRYFAVLGPRKIKIVDAPKTKFAKAPRHPEFPKRGSRKIPVKMNAVYVESEDFKNFKNREVALMFLNTVAMDDFSKFVTKKVHQDDPKIQWVSEPNANIKILFPDGKIRTAIAEPDIKKAKVGNTVQLVRVGFCRVDKGGKESLLYFTHK